MSIKKLYIFDLITVLVSLFFTYLYGFTDAADRDFIGLGMGVGYFVIAFCVLCVSCLIFFVLTILLLFEIASKCNNYFYINDLKTIQKIKICQFVIMLFALIFFIAEHKAALTHYNIYRHKLRDIFMHEFVKTYIIFIIVGIFTSLTGLKKWLGNAMQKGKGFVLWLFTVFPVLDLVVISLLKSKAKT